jgi:predicted metal-dependent hydrolase
MFRSLFKAPPETKKFFVIGGERVPYRVRVSDRARRLRLSINERRELVITLPKRASLVSAERFVYEKAVWIIRQRQRMEKIPERTVVPGGYWHFVGHKADARRLIMELIEELNKVYQVTIPKVTVRNPRTRWGSCSRDGRLSFSYKIMFLPTSVQRYIVAHELSHRKEFNHSKKFWAWVKKTIPHCFSEIE